MSTRQINAHFVLTDASLRHKWEAEPDGDERERHKNDFFHARSILLRAMTEDR